MKRLLIIGSFPPPLNGMTISNRMALKYFLGLENVKVRVFDVFGAPKIKPKNMQGIFSFSVFIKSFFENSRMVKEIILNFRGHVYIVPGQSVFGFLRFAPAILVASIFARSVSIHVHGSRFADYLNKSPFFLRLICRIILKRVDNVIALTPNLAALFNEKLDICSSTYCYNGADIPCQYDESLKYQKRTIECIFLSNLMKDKGVLDLLEAVVRANKEGISVFLHLAGEIEAGLEDSVYKYLVAYPEILEYHGPVSGFDKDSLLYKSSIFILPSYDEGVPISLLEAYANGCAVITTEVGGIPEVFQNVKNGFFCKPGDPISIVDSIRRLESDRSVLQEIGRSNRVYATKNFSRQSFGSRLVEIIFSGD